MDAKHEEIIVGQNFQINPSPQDRCCAGCGRHMDELPVYGGPGEPLVGDFTGAKLVKVFRPFTWQRSPLELLDWIVDLQRSKAPEDVRDEIDRYESASETVGASWECRECVALDHRTFLTMQSERYKSRHPAEDELEVTT